MQPFRTVDDATIETHFLLYFPFTAFLFDACHDKVDQELDATLHDKLCTSGQFLAAGRAEPLSASLPMRVAFC
jgi:uncharacterized protein YlaI